jgi:hypothetical protein
VAFDTVRRPAGGQVRLVLGEDDVRVAHAAVIGHRADAGQGAAEVLLKEPERAADAGARRPLRIGPQAAEAGVQPDLRADRPVDDDDGKRAARGGLELLASGVLVEERFDGRYQDGKILRSSARHRQRDRAALDRGHAAAGRKGAELAPPRLCRAAQDPLHSLACRGPDREAVAPAVG